MKLTPERLAEIEERAAAISSGAVHADVSCVNFLVAIRPDDDGSPSSCWISATAKDRALLFHAHTDIPLLLAHIRAREGRKE